MKIPTYYDRGGIAIYNCDNLELLREHPSESINLIYCDILYNTGKVFSDYNDNLGNSRDAVENWYRPRIAEMKRVLTKNGSIFIHCNWRLDSYMRILMDEIFGANCFRNRIYRQHSKERGFFSNFDSQVDIILYYSKDPEDFVFVEQKTENYNIVPLFENGILEGRNQVMYLDNVRPIDLSSRGKHWLVTPEQFAKMARLGEVRIIDGFPYRYSKVKPVGNLWNEPDMLDDYSRTDLAEAYDTPKPLAIIRRIFKTCCLPGDVVADFFLGGGSTAVVAKELGLKGVFCDINHSACKVTVEKLGKMEKTE